jgi:predicted esterase
VFGLRKVNSMPPQVTLRSAPSRRGGPTVQPIDSDDLCSSLDTVSHWELGACDVAFVKGHQVTFVELLVTLPAVLDPARLKAAAQTLLENASLFACLCAQRIGLSIALQGGALRFSHVNLKEDKQLLRMPPPAELFETPRRAQSSGGDSTGSDLMTLRLTTSPEASALGLTWDHALTDVGGAALFLAHLSAAYAGHRPSPPLPNHDRHLQRAHLAAAPFASAKLEPAARTVGGRVDSRRRKAAGGVAIVEWTYPAAELAAMKQMAGAQTRHEALFADVVQLLRASGHQPLDLLSLSRDDRRRLGLPREHFGNGTLITVATLPAHPASNASLCTAIRSAIETGAASAQLANPADAHFATWWHPLQFEPPLHFGVSSTATGGFSPPSPSFAVGPSTIGACARICAVASQPNLTVLPATDDGLFISLRAPLHSAHAVAALLRKRAKTKTDGGLTESITPAITPAATPSDTAGAPPVPPIPSTATTPPAPTDSLPLRSGDGAKEGRARERERLASIPPGHTPFSWLHAAESAAPPPGHSGFSWSATSLAAWRAAGRPRPGPQPPAVGQPIELPQSAPHPCALVWLHGLGDTGAGWEGKFRLLEAELPGLVREHPTAPRRPVSACGGDHLTAWFDLQTYPVSTHEPQAEAAQKDPLATDAVRRVHCLLDRLISAGIASERIALGGFSLGGAAALMAGLRYPRPLAAIASISGWSPQRTPAALARSVHAANSRTPVFFSSGTGDPVVAFKLAKQSADALAAALPDARFVFERVDRATHPPKQREMQAATGFLRHCLSRAQRGEVAPQIDVEVAAPEYDDLNYVSKLQGECGTPRGCISEHAEVK